jgi:hypothetical protein
VKWENCNNRFFYQQLLSSYKNHTKLPFFDNFALYRFFFLFYQKAFLVQRLFRQMSKFKTKLTNNLSERSSFEELNFRVSDSVECLISFFVSYHSVKWLVRKIVSVILPVNLNFQEKLKISLSNNALCDQPNNCQIPM